MSESNQKIFREMSAAGSGLKSAGVSRRQFVTHAGAAAVGLTILKPSLITRAERNAKVNLGLIGCGGRGTWIADLFLKHGGFNLVGVCDYFEDRAHDAGEKFQVPAEHRYTGLNGFKRLLEQKGLDAVAVESPPYFHPEHAAAAVEAGKHVYLAKPIAVDVPGCQTVEQAGKKATANNLCFLIDFQTRAHPAYQEAIRRVHEGAIGRLVNAEAAYQCSLMFKNMDALYRKSQRDAEARLRAWAIDRELSGDVITEQNIHALDVACWVLNAAPLRAYGTGGRTREFLGTCWDHFAVIYYFPDDVVVSFCSKQVGTYWDDIACRAYGTEGTLDTHYFGEVKILSDDPYRGGRLQNLYSDGVVNNIATFHRSILGSVWSNPTVTPSVRSNLTTILGRTAAYEKREVTWAELLARNEKFEFDAKGLKS